MTTLDSTPYKGTRDWYPEDMAVRNYIFDTWKTVAKRYGYQEYGTPLLEPLEVYVAKSGDELANEQTYAFNDRGDRQVAIRPEMTPSVSRLVATRRQELAYPARLFSIANFMRYERPQRGREREFWQLNIDMFGATGAAGDAEMIGLAHDSLQAFNATPDMYEIRINDRRLIDYVTRHYLALDGTQSQQLVKLLDRKAKITETSFEQQVLEIGVDREKLRTLLSAKGIADLPDELQTAEALTPIKELFQLLETLDVPSAVFDITLMRGLDYYTGVVFEVFDTHPENNRSMFGGGRYDGLVGLFGAENISAVGFAPGLTTTELFLRSHNLLPELSSASKFALIPLGDNIGSALQLNRLIHASSEVLSEDKNLNKQLKLANKKDVKYVVFVGDDEVNSNTYSVKNLASGEEYALTPEEFNNLP